MTPCCALAPASRWAPTSRLLAHPSVMGEGIGRGKVRNLVGWDEDSLIDNAKAARASKAKQGTHSLLPIGRQVVSHLWESRAPSRLTVTGEDKFHHSEHPLFFLLPPALYAEHDVIWYRISLGSAGVSYPRCVPCKCLVHPQPTCWQGGVRSRKGLDAVWALLSSNENIAMLLTWFPAEIQNMATWELKKLTLCKPKQVHTWSSDSFQWLE